MKKLLILLLFPLLTFAQDYDFQEMCLACAMADGYYCGDDPANWTQYAPLGCVQNSWLNDGWEDCVDATDENGAVPTSIEDCTPPVEECDTVYVEIPIIEYDTIVEIQYIIDTVYIDIINWFPEYVDCQTFLPCDSGIEELLDKSNETGLIYNLNGQVIRKPKGIYIENGKIKYLVR